MGRRQTESRIAFSQDMRRKIYNDTGGVCAHCGKAMDFYKDFTVEHVIPLYKGGTSRPENLVALCRECNEAKTDNVIQPAGYYRYLPKGRLDELEAMFERYLDTTDWLAYDNLFKTDMEDVTIPVEQTLRSGFVAKIPVNVQIRKIPKEEAFEYLQFYTARLKPEDKDVMASTPNALKSPYYRIMNGGVTYMICTAYASAINYACEDTGMETKLHGVRIDMFTNPELPDKPGLTPRLLYAGLSAVMTRIQETLLRGYERPSLVQCMVEYPNSDTYGDKIFDYVGRCYPGQFSQSRVYDENDVICPIRAQVTWFHQGKRARSLAQIDPRLEGSPEEVMAALQELQDPFKKRLDGTRRIKQDPAPVKKAKKKANPKQAHRPGKHKRKHR